MFSGISIDLGMNIDKNKQNREFKKNMEYNVWILKNGEK